MSEESDAIRSALRVHVNACCQHAWAGRCRPAQGRYCSVGNHLYEAFYAARRADVLEAMLRRLGWLRSEAS